MQGPRAAHPDEYDQLADLVNRVFRTGVDQDITTDYPLVFAPDNRENLLIVLEDDRIVTHMAIAPRTVVDRNCRFQVGMINAVATDPDYRHRGFARRVTQHALERMGDEGDDFGLLWTDGPDIYRGTGWEVVGTNGWTCLVETQSMDRFQLAHVVSVFDEKKHLDSLVNMYRSQPYRLTRSRSDYVTLFALPKVTAWVAEGEQGIEGYAVAAEAHNKEGVVEWGGSPRALESILAHVLSQWTKDRLQVFVPIRSCPMSDLLHEKGCDQRIPMEEGEGAGMKMVRIVHLRQLLERMLPYLEDCIGGESFAAGIYVTETSERVSIEADAGRIQIGEKKISNEITLTLRQAANFVFGPQKPSQLVDLPSDLGGALDRLFPFDFHIWMLDYV